MATTAPPVIGALYVLPSNGESRREKIEALRRALHDLGAIKLCNPGEEKVRAVDISSDMVVMQGGSDIHETTVLSLQSDLDHEAVVSSLAVAIAQHTRECRVLMGPGDNGFGITFCNSASGKGVRVMVSYLTREREAGHRPCLTGDRRFSCRSSPCRTVPHGGWRLRACWPDDRRSCGRDRRHHREYPGRGHPVREAPHNALYRIKYQPYYRVPTKLRPIVPPAVRPASPTPAPSRK